MKRTEQVSKETVYCDLCRKQVEECWDGPRPGYVILTATKEGTYDGTSSWDYLSSDMDLCEDCARRIAEDLFDKMKTLVEAYVEANREEPCERECDS